VLLYCPEGQKELIAVVLDWF